LVITPSNLRKQWSQELLDKFFLNSIILETKSFNQIIKEGNLNPFEHNDIVICSYQFARSKDVYIQKVTWDLAVIDEAHRLRNVYKTTNKIARAIKAALEGVPKILLTATPLQNSLLELYGLVSIIDEYTFGDLKSFKAQYGKMNSEVEQELFNELKERLKPICKRTLRKQILEYIQYTNRIALVEEFYPTEEEQREYAKLAKSIDKNSKGEKLFTVLENGFRELEKLGAPKKAIIFTESTRTQEYLLYWRQMVTMEKLYYLMDQILTLVPMRYIRIG
jgi:SNF2 family DNA or RNA helicase